MWIQNVAKSDVERGFHIDPGFNSMLIQIVDHDMVHPDPLYKFREAHQFKFLDVEQEACLHAITDDDAKALVELLKHAYNERMNVIVHCVAGVCRSGAVCDVGVAMGFQDTEVYRAPNLLVKHKMMKALGWTYDSEEQPYDNMRSSDEWEGDI